VLVDVRPSPDSPDLVLIRQKLALVDGGWQPVGDPVEEKMPLTARRARITLATSEDMQIGRAVVARVQNIGMVPLDLTKVDLEYRFPIADQKPPTPMNPVETGGSFGLAPRVRRASSVLLPGESREWVLPLDYWANALQQVSLLGPEDYKIVAYAGVDPVAEAPGRLVKPHLDIGPDGPKGLRMSLLMQNKLLGLDPGVRGRIFEAVRPLQERPPEEWEAAHGVVPVEGGQFFLAVPPDYRVLVRRHRSGAVEVVDVLRQPGVLGTVEAAGATGSGG
jgi:hypothetical protein